MKRCPIFLSVVIVLKNNYSLIDNIILSFTDLLSKLVEDYELIVVDNASTDESLSVLSRLTQEDGVPNLQIYALTKEVEQDIAFWVGAENALGDFVAAIDPLTEDKNFLEEMLKRTTQNFDIVYANNLNQNKEGFFYRNLFSFFNYVYKKINYVDIKKNSSNYRIISRKVVNFISQHTQPHIMYRHLVSASGFPHCTLDYFHAPEIPIEKKSALKGFWKGLRLLVSSTYGPLRFATLICLGGSFLNVFYSFYIIVIAFFKADVAPGWVSLSLQQSGMFFLISFVLWILSEYLLFIMALFNKEPPYYVGREFTSFKMMRHNKLNVSDYTAGVCEP